MTALPIEDFASEVRKKFSELQCTDLCNRKESKYLPWNVWRLDEMVDRKASYDLEQKV